MAVKGRAKGKPRIKINAVEIRDGKARHVFSVITLASLTQVMKVLQRLRDRPGQVEE